jgi:hypothetical protein
MTEIPTTQNRYTPDMPEIDGQSASDNLASDNQEMPSIADHFREAWDRFVASLLNLFLLSVINVLVGFLLVVLAIAIVFFGATFFVPDVSSLLKSISAQGPSAFEQIPAGFWWFLGVMGGVLFLGSLAISSVFQGAQLYVVGKSEDKPSLSKAIQVGIAVIVPFIIMNLVVSFLVMGNLALLVLPGLLIIILSLFAAYEVVLGGKGALDAIRGSFRLVKENFGTVVVRAVVLFLLWLAVSSIIQIITNNESLAGFGFFLSMILGIIYPWFAISFYIVLYQHVKRLTPEGKNGWLGFFSITAIIGWALMALLVYGLVGAITSPEGGKILEGLREEMGRELRQGLEQGESSFNSEMKGEFNFNFEDEFGSDFDQEEFFRQMFGDEAAPFVATGSGSSIQIEQNTTFTR